VDSSLAALNLDCLSIELQRAIQTLFFLIVLFLSFIRSGCLVTNYYPGDICKHRPLFARENSNFLLQAAGYGYHRKERLLVKILEKVIRKKYQRRLTLLGKLKFNRSCHTI